MILRIAPMRRATICSSQSPIMLRQPGAAAAAATGKEAKRLNDNKPFKIAAAEAAVSGSPPDSNPPCSH
jgi:hypothetical protein